MRISELNCYPIKSCRGLSLQESVVQTTGLFQDRRFMLVDADGNFITQRQVPEMALIATEMHSSGLRVYDSRSEEEELLLPWQPLHSDIRNVTVWDDKIDALDCGDKAAAFFASVLGDKYSRMSPRLVCVQDIKPRYVGSKYAGEQRYPYWFADGFPFLVVTSAALDDLNQRLTQQGKQSLPMNRFRPNVVIEGALPYEEDSHQGIRVGDGIELRFMKPCTRCKITMTDQSTAIVGAEPLQTLATYRKLSPGKIIFGQNAVLISTPGATVKVGDSVTWL